jgi:binding-protein-dependent transport system inner membrane component
MLAAIVASVIFTFAYATLAAKSRRAEMVLIPLLDVLQSVPVLGYLSFTVVFFVSLFPGSILGPEFAAIFAIFTSQAWNMTFSFFQALRTVPHDLDEASRGYRFSAWQRFWRVEVPFAMPGLVWNTMMSMSGGWFFVVVSEAIFSRQSLDRLARHQLLCRACDRGTKPPCGRVGDCRDECDDSDLRSVAVSAVGRVGGQISLRTDSRSNCTEQLAAQLASTNKSRAGGRPAYRGDDASRGASAACFPVV